MRDIRELTNDIVGKAKHFHPDEHMPDSEPFGEYPKCGAPIIERFKSCKCRTVECDFTFRNNKDGRLVCHNEVETHKRDENAAAMAAKSDITGSRSTGQ